MGSLELQLQGFRLATAEILYRLPDHPSLLQSYIWQEYDHLPDFPVLKNFLIFWEKNLDGQLYAVNIAYVDKLKTQEVIVTPYNFNWH